MDSLIFQECIDILLQKCRFIPFCSQLILYVLTFYTVGYTIIKECYTLIKVFFHIYERFFADNIADFFRIYEKTKYEGDVYNEKG